MRRDVIGAAVLERDREHEIRSPDQRVVTEPSRVADEHLAGVQGVFGRGHVDLRTVVARGEAAHVDPDAIVALERVEALAGRRLEHVHAIGAVLLPHFLERAIPHVVLVVEGADMPHVGHEIAHGARDRPRAAALVREQLVVLRERSITSATCSGTSIAPVSMLALGDGREICSGANTA